jgi:glucosamine-phosphate N-acetyltransferase
MNVRQIQINDFEMGLMDLLGQLTEAPNIKFEDFVKQFIKFGYNTRIYVIEYEKRIIGYGSIYIDYKFYRNCKNVGHIEDLIIDEKFRGNGYSKLIVKELIEFGKEKECYKIILNCKDHYVGFYQKMGFKLNDNTMSLKI